MKFGEVTPHMQPEVIAKDQSYCMPKQNFVVEDVHALDYTKDRKIVHILRENFITKGKFI